MDEKVLLRNVGVPDSHEIKAYIERGGYQALPKTLKEYKPEERVELVRASGLRGRGGLGFPAGVKWGFLPKEICPRYLICNADEGEPGTFKDQVLIEGIIISSYACQAELAFIYIRGEYALGADRLERAVEQACERGYLGQDIPGSGYNLELVVHRGAGAYICAEETALMASVEG